jgi:hypothetical protein
VQLREVRGPGRKTVHSNDVIMFDAVSLFTSIPDKQVVVIFSRRWDGLAHKRTALNEDVSCEILEFCQGNDYCQ